MTRCLISLSEGTVALIVTLRNSPGESLESVVRRLVDAHVSASPSISHTQVLTVPAASGHVVTQGHHSVTLFGKTTAVPTKQDVLATILPTPFHAGPSLAALRILPDSGRPMESRSSTNAPAR